MKTQIENFVKEAGKQIRPLTYDILRGETGEPEIFIQQKSLMDRLIIESTVYRKLAEDESNYLSKAVANYIDDLIDTLNGIRNDTKCRDD
jgi:hypothetical protein